MAQKFIPSRTDLNFTFPFAIQYNPTYDTDQSVLSDLAEKCGLTGGAKSDITIDYTIRFQAKVLVIKVHPTISSSATFACPLDVNIIFILFIHFLTLFLFGIFRAARCLDLEMEQ